MSSDIALGQLGSGHLGDAGAFTPPAGKVVVAITCVQDTSFSVLLFNHNSIRFDKKTERPKNKGIKIYFKKLALILFDSSFQ